MELSPNYHNFDLTQDEFFFPPEFEGKSPSNFEPFIGKEISEIHQFEQLDDELFSDSKAIIDIFGSKSQRQSTEEKFNSHRKKPRSQVLSNSEPYEHIAHLQSPKNHCSSSTSHRFSQLEKNRRENNVHLRSKQQPSPDYFNHIPKEQIVQIKSIFKNSCQTIKDIIQNSKETFNLAQILESSQGIGKNIAEQQQVRQNFFRYCKIQSLNKQTQSFRDDQQQMENAICQKLAKLQQRLLPLGQIDRKVNYKPIFYNPIQNQNQNVFMRKDTVYTNLDYKTIESKRETDRGSVQQNFQMAKQKNKLKEKTLLKEMKTIFSYNPLTQDQMRFSRQSIFDSQPLSNRLQKILTLEISDPQSLARSSQGQRLRKFLQQKKKRIVRQKIHDYVENKKILFQMVSNRLKEQTEINSMQQKDFQSEKDGSNTEQKILLKNIKPIYIDTATLKYRSSKLNREQTKKLDLIPENCQVLYYMRDPEINNQFFKQQKDLIINSLKNSQKLKNSASFSNRPNNQIATHSLNLPNNERQKSVNRVDRDFSPAKINKMTSSVMVPNKGPQNQSPDKDEEKDIYNDQDWLKSSQWKQRNHKSNIPRSSKFGNINKLGNESYSTLIKKSLDRKQLYREAYEKYKPQGPIGILEFYESGIIQKCNEYVDQKLGKNNKKASTKTYCHKKFGDRVFSQQKNTIAIHYDEPMEGSGQEDADYEMRINEIMNLWTQPKNDFLNQSQCSEQQNLEIKKLLHLGPYKAISGDTKIRNFSKPQIAQINSQKASSQDLAELKNEFETNQRNFQRIAKRFLKPHKTTTQDIFNQLSKARNQNKTLNSPEDSVKQTRPKISRAPKSNQKSINFKIELKKAISEQQNQDQDDEKPQNEQKIPMFKIPSDHHISPLGGQNSKQKDPILISNTLKKSNQTVSSNQKNSIKSGQSMSNKQQLPSNQNHASSKQSENTSSSLKVVKGPLPSKNQQSPPSLPSQLPTRVVSASSYSQPKVEERKQTKPQQKKQEKPLKNIFEQKKHQPEKNIFQQNQNNPPKIGFGQQSNIFSTNSQQNPGSTIFSQNPSSANSQSNPPQYPSFSPPQFASFSPQDFKPFQTQQAPKNFTNFASQGQQNNNFQQINQQLGQQFSSSMGSFESFGPEAFRGQGPSGFGGNIFNTGNQNQQNFSNMNPFRIIHETNALTNVFQQQPGVTQNQLQPRK